VIALMVDVLTSRLAATLPGAPDAAEERPLERLLNHRGGDRDTTVNPGWRFRA